jgi:class 3 adenylate cyclase
VRREDVTSCAGVRGGTTFGVVTFLFTDIEGSTRRWEADADAMRSALSAHDEVLRTAIEARGGFLFSHTGDGVDRRNGKVRIRPNRRGPSGTSRRLEIYHSGINELTAGSSSFR